MGIWEKSDSGNVASKGMWMSRLNYCGWSAGSADSSNQVVCDEFGNVLELNLGELYSDMTCHDLLQLCMLLAFSNKHLAHNASIYISYPCTGSNNMIGTIPLEIGALAFMSSYISSSNAISGAIPTSLGLIVPLQTFDISLNNMTGELFQAEYSGLNGLAEVVQFVVDSNNFQGNIPTEIGLWSRLQTLGISGNKITGTIPTEIGKLVDMSEF